MNKYDKFRNVAMMFYFVIGGTILTGAVLIVLREFFKLNVLDETFRSYAIFIVTAIVIVCMFIATKLFSNDIQKLKTHARSSAEKFSKYIVSLMKFLVICETGAAICFIAYFLTGDPMVLLPAIVVILFMVLKRPTQARIFNDLELDSKEQMELI